MKVARSLGRTSANGLRIGGEELLPAVHRRLDVRLGVAQHHHVLERRDLVDDPLGPVGEVGLHEEHPSTGVGQLVAQVLALVGGVDGDGHAAAGDDPPPRQHRLVRVLDERGDAVAPLDPEARQGARRSAPAASATSAAEVFTPHTSRYSPSGSDSSRRARRSSTVSCSPLIHTSELMGDEPYGYSTTSES